MEYEYCLESMNIHLFRGVPWCSVSHIIPSLPLHAFDSEDGVRPNPQTCGGTSVWGSGSSTQVLDFVSTPEHGVGLLLPSDP